MKGLVLVLALSACSSQTPVEPLNTRPADAISKRYENVSTDAPEALKPFYDQQLTESLNR